MGTEIVSDILKMEMNPPPNVILVIDGLFNKSNTWVTLLLWPTIRSHVTHIVKTPFEAWTIYTKSGVKTLVIHPDDCTYSGSQFGLALQTFDLQTNIIPHLIQTKNSNPGHFNYYMCFPYISSTAIRNLNAAYFGEKNNDNVINYLKIPKSTTIIHSFHKQLGQSIGDVKRDLLFNLMGRESETPEAVLFQWTENTHAVYFDHKLADSVSIFNKLLAFGPYRNPDENKIITSNLIENCGKFKYIPSDVTEAFTDFNDDGVCPSAFYKFIKYLTVNNNKKEKIKQKILEDTKFVDFLDAKLNKKPTINAKNTGNIKCIQCHKKANYIESKTMLSFCDLKCRSLYYN